MSFSLPVDTLTPPQTSAGDNTGTDSELPPDSDLSGPGSVGGGTGTTTGTGGSTGTNPNPGSGTSSAAPKITRQPSGEGLSDVFSNPSSGDPVGITFVVLATGTDLLYQWYKLNSLPVSADATKPPFSPRPVGSGGTLIPGATNYTFPIEALTHETALAMCGQYYCVVSNSLGSVTTYTALFYFYHQSGSSLYPLDYNGNNASDNYGGNPPNTGAPIADPDPTDPPTDPPADPQITVQPVSSSVVSGALAAVSIRATGTLPLAYQWYKNGLAYTGNGSNTNTLTLTDTSLYPGTTDSYYCVVTNANGMVQSTVATITVFVVPTKDPSLSFSAPTPNTIGKGPDYCVQVVQTNNVGPGSIGVYGYYRAIQVKLAFDVKWPFDVPFTLSHDGFGTFNARQTDGTFVSTPSSTTIFSGQLANAFTRTIPPAYNGSNAQPTGVIEYWPSPYDYYFVPATNGAVIGHDSQNNPIYGAPRKNKGVVVFIAHGVLKAPGMVLVPIQASAGANVFVTANG